MGDQNKYTSKLANARVLVIGGTSGIGYTAAECLLEHNIAHLTISSSNQQRVVEKISALQKSYPSKASRVTGYACNLGDKSSLESNIKKLFDDATENNTKKLDHVIHTAGDPLKVMSLKDVDLDTLIQGGMVRFFSAIMMCKYAPNYMNDGPAASITLTTGAVSERPRPGWGVPVGFATGLHGVARGMALDLAPLRVNVISPGAVATELWDHMVSSPEQKNELFKKSGQGMATGVIGKPEDIAETYLYCVKDENLTGSVLSTNGGALLM
ncbi:MAG: hypothetical protein Q9162_006511 [Coniocarpon cinnabarinum]